MSTTPSTGVRSRARTVAPAAGRPALRARNRPVLASLARTEAARLVRHPAFVLGALATLAANVLPVEEEWGGQRHYLSLVSWTFVWMGTLAAAALIAGRQRFLSEPDLFPGVPVTGGDRVLATGAALAGPALVTAVLVGVVAAMTAARGGFVLGEEGYQVSLMPSLAEWAQPVVLVVLAGAVGIALAQLRRARLAALMLLVFATFFCATIVWAFQVHPLRVLHPFMYPSYERALPPSFDPAAGSVAEPPLLPPDEWTTRWREVRFDTAALGWHLLYVVGLVLLVGWWAVRAADRRQGEDRGPPRWLLRAGVPLLLLGGVAQLLAAGTNP